MAKETFHNQVWWDNKVEEERVMQAHIKRHALQELFKLESDARKKLDAVCQFIRACENPDHTIEKSSVEVIKNLGIGSCILEENKVFKSVGRRLQYDPDYVRLKKRLKSKL